MGSIATICFFIGFILLVIEIFVPGFGFFGITGTLFLAVAITMVARTALEAVLLLLLLAACVGILFYFLYRSASKGRLGRKLILKDALNLAGGFSSSADLSSMTGATGLALTTLRPAGIAELDGVRRDVLAEGEYINAGEKITVIRVEGSKLIVKKFYETEE